jgi:hypothetical protein
MNDMAVLAEENVCKQKTHGDSGMSKAQFIAK